MLKNDVTFQYESYSTEKSVILYAPPFTFDRKKFNFESLENGIFSEKYFFFTVVKKFFTSETMRRIS
jgi:hypothetical protein